MKYSEEGFHRSVQSSLLPMVAGIVLVGLAGFNLINGVSGAVTFNTLFDMLGVTAGLFFFWTGLRTRKTAQRFPRYCKLIVDEGVRSADRLAQLMEVSPATALRDVKAMIYQKILLDARLSEEGEISDIPRYGDED